MTLRLVPDCGGLIEEVAITVPLALLPSVKSVALARLVEALPAGITLFLMTDDAAAPAFRDWYDGLALSCNVQIVSAGSDGPILESEMWSQDPWMIAEEAGRTVLWHPTHTERPGRQAQWFAAFRPLPYDRPALHLAGGNALIGPDFRLVGAQSIEFTCHMGNGPTDYDAGLARHAALDPRRLHVFGFSLPTHANVPTELRQQPHHIDLVVSLTGLSTHNGRPIILVADPRKTLDPDGPRMEGWAEQLDQSAVRLEADGFCVMRNKVPYLAHPVFSPNPNLRAYNNVLVENDTRTRPDGASPHIWMPHFGDLEPELASYDDENAQIWRGLGFEVIPVYGWSALVRSGGAIRCASKILKRKNDPASES